jgi:hypothetical protein
MRNSRKGASLLRDVRGVWLYLDYLLVTAVLGLGGAYAMVKVLPPVFQFYRYVLLTTSAAVP